MNYKYYLNQSVFNSQYIINDTLKIVDPNAIMHW